MDRTLPAYPMKNARRIRWVACAPVVIACLTSCRKEPPQWDVDVLGPVVWSTFTLGDLVADSNLTADAGGLLTLVYTGELFSVDLDSLFNAPDTSFTYDYALPFGTVNVGPGTDLPPIVEEVNLDVDELQLRYLELREGKLDLTLRNKITSGVIGTFNILGGTYQGSMVSLQQFVPAGSVPSPAYATASRDLAFHRFDLTGPTYDAVNTLATELLLQLDPNGSGATLTNADTIQAIATYSGLKPQYARGFFGQRTVHYGPDTSDFDLFKNIIAGSIDLDLVEVDLKVTSGFGVDARVTLDHLTAIRTSTGTGLDLDNSLIGGAININRAIDLGGSFAPSVYERALDNTNSNIDAMVELLPDKLGYELDLEINPLGDISNGNDFLYWKSDLRAELQLRVPLTLIATDLTLQQFSTPDLPGTAEEHAVQYGGLTLYAVNGFPFSAVLQLDIVDDAGNVIANLPVQGTVAAGMLGPDQHVSAPVSSQVSTYLDASEVDLLYAHPRLRTTVVFNTADQTQHLEILDSYQLDLQMVFDGNYVINGNE